MNLTVLQIEFLESKIKNDINKMKELQEIINTKKYMHDNTKAYYIKFDNYYIESTNNNINLYVNNIIDTNYTKWKYSQLKNAIDSEINKYNYRQTINNFMEIYYYTVCGNWFKDDTYKLLNEISYILNIQLSSNITVKRDRITNNIYAIIKDDAEIKAYKYKNQLNYCYSQKNINIRDSYYNNIDFNNVNSLIEMLKEKEYIKPFYINDSDNTYKNIVTERISNNIEVVKEYFNNNILPNLINKKCYISY